MAEFSELLGAIAIECCRRRELMMFPVLKLANEPEEIDENYFEKKPANMVFMSH
jgi:hypothetical protein